MVAGFKRKVSFFIYLMRGMLHICLVTFISFISFTKIHLFISYTRVQLIHFVIRFHLIHFTDDSPFHSHSPYLVLLILHCSLTSLFLSFFLTNPHSGVSLDKILIGNIYCIIEAEL